jgi:pimeloyl-ACP methyl ester carboxylesterase
VAERNPDYATGTVISGDGTVVGYREVGQGPGVIALHGGLQAAQNLMKLACALADSFTVYLPDRRGRGLSGPPGDGYGLEAECADVAALARATGARNLFGLSSGGIVALRAALTLPAIRRVAVYEPPFSVDHSVPLDWVAQYDAYVAQGKLGRAAIAVSRGTQTARSGTRLLPPSALGVMADRREPRDEPAVRHGDVPLRDLVPTMRYDVQLVRETEGTLAAYAAVSAEVLLLGGSKSPAYLAASLDALGSVLPLARRVELEGHDHMAPDNGGRPARVAQELRAFYAGS